MPRRSRAARTARPRWSPPRWTTSRRAGSPRSRSARRKRRGDALRGRRSSRCEGFRVIRDVYATRFFFVFFGRLGFPARVRRVPLNFLVLRRAFVGDAVPWRSKATIFRGTERTYQILGRVPPSTPWATIQSRAGQSFFSFLFPSARRARRFDVPSRDARSPYRTTSHLFRYTVHP